MAKITYIEANGREHEVDVPSGHSLMEGARDNNVSGILADCSGSCACGTCKVIVPEDWRARLPEISDLESATLEMHDDAKPGERLACQILVSDDLAGLVVTMPEKQF